MGAEKLDIRTAVITGASSGLGRGLAEWFADRGVKVWAAARRKDALETLREACAARGGQLVPLRLDVADARNTLRTLERVDEESGGVDLVVANAGVAGITDARKLAWPDVERIIGINVTGAAATLSALLPRMVARGRGHLVGVSSLAAWRGLPRSAAYSASKAFLATFLEGLRVDLAQTGVKVTSIHPGFVKSEMTRKNKHPMPFLLETDEAVALMGRAIVRQDAEFAFPWQLSSMMRLAKVLPNGLWNVAARRMR
jgi:NADP-dependent 3-hydroxy acid dehydrogenase YdfG